jgi:seryl-tRNA synthetase
VGIAHRLRGRTFDANELPAFFCAESRCFRPEVSQAAAEHGLYRVHEFTKVNKSNKYNF